MFSEFPFLASTCTPVGRMGRERHAKTMRSQMSISQAIKHK